MPQSAGATFVLSSVREILVAGVSVGVVIMVDGEPVAVREIPPNPLARGNPPGGASNDGNENDPPHQTIPREYVLTPPAVQAITKSWDVPLYNPPGTDISGWLSEAYRLREVYGVPVARRSLCVMHNVRVTCRGAASTDGCREMMWDQFTSWLCEYDGNALS
jgi:hypothetical protein